MHVAEDSVTGCDPKLNLQCAREFKVKLVFILLHRKRQEAKKLKLLASIFVKKFSKFLCTIQLKTNKSRK